MSTIILLSGGNKLTGFISKEQETILGKYFINMKNLVSIGAKREYEKNDIYFYGNEDMKSVMKTFVFCNIEKFDLIDARTSKDDGRKLLENADVIYLQGGDPFIQLKYIVENDYVNILSNFKGIIIGVSAGSMNLGTTCFYSKDNDYPNTVFYKGLGLINLTIDPHFDINDKSKIIEIKKGSINHDIIGLPDYSMIVIDKNNIIEYGINYKYSNGVLQKNKKY